MNAKNQHFEAQGRLTDVLHQELQSAQVSNVEYYSMLLILGLSRRLIHFQLAYLRPYSEISFN